MRSSIKIGSILLLVSLSAASLLAQPPTSFECDTDVSDLFLGVTGSSGLGTSGTANTLYVVNGATGATAAIPGTDNPLSEVPNHLAFDSAKQLAYYIDHTGDELFVFDLNSGVETSIHPGLAGAAIPGDGDLPGGFTGHDAGTYWNGRYWIIPHGGTSGQTGSDLHWIEFSANGLTIVDSGTVDLSLPGGNTHMGDFGDIVITQAGILFGSSSDQGASQLEGLWTADLNDAGGEPYAVTVLNADYTGAQLALTGDEDLYGNEWTEGEIVLLDKSDGSEDATVTIDFGGDFFDLAPVSPHTCDYGDLPDGYATQSGSNGPAHKAGVFANVMLGASVDSETDGQASADASGDGSDDDGVTFLTPMIPGEVTDIEVEASAIGVLNAWIDFNSDGDFADTNEQIATNTALVAGTITLDDVTVPSNATGVMAARFRATVSSGEGGGSSTGAADNGEVEDYMLSAIGNRVWNDSVDGDGIQDGGEVGVSGVVVNLLESDGSTAITTGDGTAVTTTTDGSGNYEFPGLPIATYTVEFERPAAFQDFSPGNQGADDTLDSDPDQVIDGATEGITSQTFVMAAAAVDNTVDAGLRAFTAALITSTGAYVDGRSVVFEFSTGYEAMTSAFEVMRWDRELRDYVSVTERPIEALIGSPQGGVYRVADPGGLTGEVEDYVVVEHQAGGRTQVYGPFSVIAGDRLDRPALLSDASATPRTSQRLKDRMDAAVRSDRAQATALADRGGVKTRGVGGHARVALQFDVVESGLHYVAAAEIAAASGFPEEKVRHMIGAGKLALENQGEPVAWMAAEPQPAGLYFYGESIDSLYTVANTYWLRLREPGTLMAVDPGKGPSPVSGASFDSREGFEEDVIPAINSTTRTEVDHWYWDGLNADSSEPTRQFDVSVPDALGGTARLTARFVGASNGGAFVDHHAVVRVNGVEVGVTSWSALDRHVEKFTFAGSLLTETTTIEVEGILDGGSNGSIFFIDGFDLIYERQYRAVGDRLVLTGDRNRVVTVEGFGASDVVALDLSDPRAPRVLEGVRIDADGADFKVSLSPRDERTPYLVSSLSAALPAANMRRVESNVDLLSDVHNYEHVVIAPAAWRTEAEDFSTYRTGHGIRSLAVDIEEIYNTFSDGIVTPWAIRDFLAYAHENWSKAPEFAAVAGRGTLDPRDILGDGDNFVPTVQIGTPYGLAPSDNVLADLTGDDSVPEVFIGRLPIVSAVELANYVQRLEAYEAATGPWLDRALMLSDNSDTAGDFLTQSDAVGALLASYTRQDVSLETTGVAQVRTALQAAWNQGVQLVNYVGHSGVTVVAHEQILTTTDMAFLINGEKLPIVSALTCILGRSDVPGVESVAEALVTDIDGGAIAVWAPSGLSLAGAAHELNLHYAAVLEAAGPSTSLGSILTQVMQQYAAAGGSQEMLDLYGVTGDPAVKVH